jgi:elongation factor G
MKTYNIKLNFNKIHILQDIGANTRNNIKGGVVPIEFIPAVEKGIKEAMERGIVAGYKMVDVSAELYDGSYHDVDSSEVAFKLAASHAFQEAAARARASILEPIMKVEIVIPDQNTGDITGDISSKRGQIEGMEERGMGIQSVRALVPLSEMFGYTTRLAYHYAGCSIQ